MLNRNAHSLLVVVMTLLGFASAVLANGCPERLQVIRHAGSQLDDDDRFLLTTLSALGCELTVQRSPNRVTLLRRLELLRDGEIDLVIGLSKFPEREAYAHFSIPYREERVRLWARREDAGLLTGKTPAQLLAEHWRIIGPTQGWFGPGYDAVRKQPERVVEYKTFEQAMRLLHGRRGDLILGEEVWASAYATSQIERLYLVPELVYSEPLFVAFSKATVPLAFVQKFDQQIREQRKKTP